MGRILNNEQLKGFEKYKYKSIDTSILSKHVMHPFWNWCVQFCPIWVAPNLLTFTGFLLTLVNFLLFAYYDFGFNSVTEDVTKESIPRWVWIVAAANLFIAYTLDGIDGKQARRTGTSGPLGELFDHGLDSYSTVLMSTCLYSIFGRNQLSTIRFFFVLWNVFINFYLTHWEKYNTGVMFLPWGYDFTMNGMWIVLLVTGLFGPGVWRLLSGGVAPGVLCELILYVSAMLTSQTVILWNIYRSYRDGTGKMRSAMELVRPLVPVLTLFVLSSAWALKSRHLMTRDPRAYYLLVGTVFSNINCRLIVAQMSDTRCDAWSPLLLTFCLGAGAAWVLPSAEILIMRALCAFSCLSHVYYGTKVVQDLCEHFKIKCFRIKVKPQQE